MKQATEESILNELNSLKKLMIMTLFDKGYTQNQVALALGVNQTTVSRMFPKGALKIGKGKRNADNGE